MEEKEPKQNKKKYIQMAEKHDCTHRDSMKS